MSAPSAPGAVLARSPRIVARKIAGECVLVPLAERGAELDSIYSLNAVGAFIWERLDGRTPGGAIVSALVEAFEVDADTAGSDYARFVEALASIRAVQAVG